MHEKLGFSRKLTAVLLTTFTAAACAGSAHYDGRTEYRAPYSAHPITIDGVADEEIWQDARWQDGLFAVQYQENPLI